MSTKAVKIAVGFNEFRRELFYFFSIDVFLSLVKDDEPPLCFEMISHLIWHLPEPQWAKTEQFLGIIVAIHDLKSALNISCI